MVTHDPLEATGLELQDVLEASISDSLVLHDVVEDDISDSLVLHDVVEDDISDSLVLHDVVEAGISDSLVLHDVVEAGISDSLVLHDVVEAGISDSLVLHDVVEAGISDSVWVSSSAFCRNTAFHTLAAADLPIFIFSFVPLTISSKLGSTILRAHTAGTVHPAYLPSCHSTIIMSSFSVTAL